MAQPEYSKHQKDIIAEYYRHLDTIMLNKLQTLVSELYMTEAESKRQRLWQRVHKAMIRLNIPDPVVEHIMSKKNVEVLAQNLQDWLRYAGRTD